MRLTKFLTKSDVCEKLNSEYIKPRLLTKKSVCRSTFAEKLQLGGNRFDYLLRCHLEYLNSPFIENRTGWVAEWSLLLLSGTDREKSVTIIEQAKKNWSIFLETGHHDDELLKSALLLAGLDAVFRSSGKRGQAYIGLIDDQACKI